MNICKKNLFFLYVFFIPVAIIFAQTNKCDSVILSIKGYDEGTIQWQISNDGLVWNDLPGTDTSSIRVLASHDKYYRAFVSTGCSIYYSDSVFNIKPYPFTQKETDTIYNGSATTLMRVMNIYNQPDSVILRTPSTNIAPCDTATLVRLMNRMRKTVINPAHPGVGIAAPQVGINRNAVYVQRYDKIGHPFEFYINPVIVAHSDTTFLDPDGCLSVPIGGSYPVWVTKTYRWIWVLVEYNQIDGTFKREKIIHRFTSHIFQHELDHLYGIMYFDHTGAKQLQIKVSSIESSEWR